MKLWIGNIAPNSSDEEIDALFKKYAPGIEISKIERMDGDGSHPLAIVEIVGKPYELAEQLTMRLSGMNWKGRELVAATLMH